MHVQWNLSSTTPWRKDTSGMRTLYYVPLYLRITQPQEPGHHIYQSLLNRKVLAYRTPYCVPNLMQLEMTSITMEQQHTWSQQCVGGSPSHVQLQKYQNIYNITNVHEWTVPPHHFHHQAGIYPVIYIINNIIHCTQWHRVKRDG